MAFGVKPIVIRTAEATIMDAGNRAILERTGVCGTEEEIPFTGGTTILRTAASVNPQLHGQAMNGSAVVSMVTSARITKLLMASTTPHGHT